MWKFNRDLPKKYWCDIDYMADLFERVGYEPKEISVEELAERILDAYDQELFDHGVKYFAIPDIRPYPENLMVNAQDVEQYVIACGGFAEFDYKG